MKEKRVLLALFILFFTAVLSVFSNVNMVSAAVNETEKINLAYNWLSGKVATWPSGDEGAYALMALAYDDALAQKGKTALLAASRDNGTCWPSASCNVKSTALAIIALNIINEDTAKAENWLLSREKSYTDPSAEWHLQIDSSDATRCTIEYDDRAYGVNLTKSKEFVQASAGTCLARSTYGFKIATSCLDKTFLIKCDNDFYVSMIYSKGSVLYVPGTTKAGSSGSYVETKIETVCLADGSSCSYEGTEWGAYALALRGRDNSMLIPYLIGFADQGTNPLKMPEAFLYLATSDSAYADSLLTSQHSNGYWFVSTDKIYDTAIAILALKDYNPDAKTKAKDYILTAQASDGSWKDIKDTSLTLFVFGSRTITPVIQPPGVNDCEQRGFTCRDTCNIDEDEKAIYDYACSGQICCGSKTEKTCISEGYQCCDKCSYGHQTSLDGSCVGNLCCSQCLTEQSCSDLGGTFCATGEECSITPQKTSDGDCCTGECRTPSRTCAEMNGQLCEKGSCTGTLQYATDGRCCVGGECKQGSYLWLIILLIVIVGAVLFFLNKKGIIKLGALFKKKPKPPVSPFGFPISARPQPVQLQPQQPARTASARPVIRPLQQWPQAQPLQKPTTRTDKELEETFRKIKEI